MSDVILAFNLSISRSPNLDRATEANLQHCLATWGLILGWVRRKKTGNKYKIFGDRDSVKSFEALGEIYFRLFELCIQLHPYAADQYFSATTWFSSICDDELHLQKQEALAITNDLREPPLKSEAIKILRSQAQQLRDFKNPFNPKIEPHLYRLIDLATKHAERERRFASEFWRPYTRAFTNWVQVFEHDPAWNLRYVIGGQLKYTSGRGRNRGLALPLPPQNESFL